MLLGEDEKKMTEEKWYCWKCREEAPFRYGEKWYLEDLTMPMSQLKEDASRKGYYLCGEHRKSE